MARKHFQDMILSGSNEFLLILNQFQNLPSNFKIKFLEKRREKADQNLLAPSLSPIIHRLESESRFANRVQISRVRALGSLQLDSIIQTNKTIENHPRTSMETVNLDQSIKFVIQKAQTARNMQSYEHPKAKNNINSFPTSHSVMPIHNGIISDILTSRNTLFNNQISKLHEQICVSENLNGTGVVRFDNSKPNDVKIVTSQNLSDPYDILEVLDYNLLFPGSEFLLKHHSPRKISNVVSIDLQKKKECVIQAYMNLLSRNTDIEKRILEFKLLAKNKQIIEYDPLSLSKKSEMYLEDFQCQEIMRELKNDKFEKLQFKNSKYKTRQVIISKNDTDDISAESVY